MNLHDQLYYIKYNLKKHLKNERGCRNIKTKKAQEKDWNGTIATYIARVKVKYKEAILMKGCYVEVVFNK